MDEAFPQRENSLRVVQGEEIWATDAILQSTFYNEFLKKVDVLRLACVAFCGSPGIFEGFSLYRGPHEDEFDREELGQASADSASSANCPLYPQKIARPGVESL